MSVLGVSFIGVYTCLECSCLWCLSRSFHSWKNILRVSVLGVLARSVFLGVSCLECQCFGKFDNTLSVIWNTSDFFAVLKLVALVNVRLNSSCFPRVNDLFLVMAFYH